MENTSSVALLVHASDRYQLLFKGFEYFFSKHWNTECRRYFATEEIEANVRGFKNIKSGRGAWSDRLRNLLTHHISEEYVLYMQEDMWFTKPVDPNFINSMFQLAASHNWPLIKLHSSNVYYTRQTSIYLQGFNVTLLDNNHSEYLMSHQISLWRRDFLIEQLENNEHPWRNEKRGSLRLRDRNPIIMHIDYFADNGACAINENQSNAKRSEYYGISRNARLNEHSLPFIEELSGTSDTQLQQYAQQLHVNYLQNITHDGLPSPRQEDIFKKMKTWLLS
jgi:hypothetical protein